MQHDVHKQSGSGEWSIIQHVVEHVYMYFSDISENEAELGDVSDGTLGSDDETISLYCVCGLPATKEMIACNAEACKIEWFHFQCVGLITETIPFEQWFCKLCR